MSLLFGDALVKSTYALWQRSVPLSAARLVVIRYVGVDSKWNQKKRLPRNDLIEVKGR